MGARSTNPTQSFFDDFFRSGTEASGPNAAGFSATGGTKSTVGSRTYHVFAAPNYDPAPSTFVVSGGSKSVSYLVVGGGGGGGGPFGGGGGAGAVKTELLPGFEPPPAPPAPITTGKLATLIGQSSSVRIAPAPPPPERSLPVPPPPPPPPPMTIY